MNTQNFNPSWLLSDAEKTFVQQYRGGNRLQCALFLKFFQKNACFPKSAKDIPYSAVRCLSEQLHFRSELTISFDNPDRTMKRQRQDIRIFLGIRAPQQDDYAAIQAWLACEIIQDTEQERALHDHVKLWCLNNKVELPAFQQQERIIKGAVSSFEEGLFKKISGSLSKQSRKAMDSMFVSVTSENEENSMAPFSVLKGDAGKPSLNSVFTELTKLEQINELKLPYRLFEGLPRKTLHLYRSRAATESIRDMRRHPEVVRYTLGAAFFYERRREVMDSLVELLIQVIHKIKVQAEKKVTKEFASSIREVSNKKTTLFKLAEAAMANPDGKIRDVLFPVISEEVFANLIKEYQARSPIYTERVEVHIRNSYKGHYRRMLPLVLAALDFQSSNTYHQPIIEALSYLQQQKPTQRHVPVTDVPIDGIVPQSLRSLLIEDGSCGQFINRISYEICVLRALRDGLRCREIWVNGADRYRNPDEDVPQDFEKKRESYYKDLDLPMEADLFVRNIQNQMKEALGSLNKNLPRNKKVSLRQHGKNRIKLSPLEAQPEATFLETVKSEIAREWPLTSLLDIVKEADVQTGFTNSFRGLGDREVLSRDVLQKRLLLALYALGTNTGLKRILAGGNDVSYDELRHVRERYIHKDALRSAISTVVNATLKVRQPELWGEGTMGCASDSKKIHAWDQNLMSEWHIRYKGRGVMVYWHVEKNSLCIYSQLKRCSSSEVGSMIEGVMRHCTDVEIQKQYVDSHGQSEVAFAFCELLGFSLMPRLKGIARQKLYLPESGTGEQYNNLLPILTRPINWGLITQQYDQMVKYAAALQKGTAHADSILRRFTRNNKQHPTYQALAELGRAMKTIFLCQYLESEELRQEIHGALNVVENCNSTVEFIFFARNSELSSNQFAKQEISMLALHLLQVCMVYVNTMMIQQVLSEKGWMGSMSEEDFRSITPLIYLHITPYGSFELDMAKRLFPRPLKLAA